MSRVNKNKREMKAWLEEIKAGKSCLRCGEDHPACLDFHHRDPKTKSFSIGGDVAWNRYSKSRILAEIAKCDVLCANCHRKYHFMLRARRLVSPVAHNHM